MSSLLPSSRRSPARSAARARAAARRDRAAASRLAGLAAWGAGAAGLALYLAPTGTRRCSPPRPRPACAPRRRGRVRPPPLARGCSRSRRSPARRSASPCRVGDDDANLLLPLYVVVARVGARARLGARSRRRARRELGPLACRSPRSSPGRASRSRWSEDVREGAIFAALLLLPFGLLAVWLARLPWRGRSLPWLCGALAARRSPTRRSAIYQWADARRLLEPEGDRRQRLRAVLPRQLGLLRPVDLRALSRRRDPRGARGRPARRRPRWLAVALAPIVATWVGPALLLLAVELRGARAPASSPRRARLALAAGAALALAAVVLPVVGPPAAGAPRLCGDRAG